MLSGETNALDSNGVTRNAPQQELIGNHLTHRVVIAPNEIHRWSLTYVESNCPIQRTPEFAAGWVAAFCLVFAVTVANRIALCTAPSLFSARISSTALCSALPATVGFSLGHVVSLGQLWWDAMTATISAHDNTRQRKASRIVRKLREVSHRLPSAADAAFFLRNAVRSERVIAGRTSFAEQR
jgi:hypothetical protein